MKGHLLPWWLESEIAAGFRCQFCRRSGQAVYLRPPLLQRHGAEIRVYYPVRCGACNKVSGVGLRTEVLFLAYVKLWTTLYGQRRKPSDAEICVTPAPANTLAKIRKEFCELLAEHGGSIAGKPNDVDRQGMGFCEEDWADFLRRLGVDEETHGNKE